MFEAHSRVTTEKAGQYIAQLCKHFSHKAESAEWSETQGDVVFGPYGACRMAVMGGALVIDCRSESEEGLGRVKYILEDHLVRFGWREKLAMSWSDGASEQQASDQQSPDQQAAATG